MRDQYMKTIELLENDRSNAIAEITAKYDHLIRGLRDLISDSEAGGGEATVVENKELVRDGKKLIPAEAIRQVFKNNPNTSFTSAGVASELDKLIENGVLVLKPNQDTKKLVHSNVWTLEKNGIISKKKSEDGKTAYYQLLP